jgi:hypothetical protein
MGLLLTSWSEEYWWQSVVGWLVAGSEEYWWQSVVGSLIQVLLPWSVTQSGASVDMTWLDALWSRCYWVAGWSSLGLRKIGGSQWWAL